MEIRQLEYFVTSVEEKSFQKASQKLFTSQPAVSKAIANLEKDVNTKLFERTSKGLKVTSKGEKLYYHAKNILQQVSVMKDIDFDESAKSLVLASYPSYMISNALTDFYNQNKGMISLDYREGNVQLIINLVDKGEVEFGILYISPNQEDLLNHILAHKQLEFVHIQESELCVYVGKAHPLYGKDATITTQEMSELKYLRGVRDFFSVEHHFNYINLNDIDTASFDDKVLTDSDNLVSAMLAKTDLAYLGINTTVQAKDSKVLLNAKDKDLNLGYIKYKATKLSSTAEKFLEHLKQYI